MSKRRKPPPPPISLEQELDAFLDNLCVKYGFCNQLTGEILLADRPVLTDTRFVKLVLEYEELPASKEWSRKLSRLFQNKFGYHVDSETFEARDR